MKLLYILLLLMVIQVSAADNVIVPPGSGNSYLKSASGDLFPLGVFYTTDGNGNILTLGKQALVAENLFVPKNSGKAYLKDNASRLFPASILYMTDGNGNVSPFSSSSSSGISNLNGLTDLSQTFATGLSGTDFGIVSSSGTHTFNLPSASATKRGLLTSADWSSFNGKQSALSFTSPIVNTTGTISCNAASGSQAGCLSSTDWSIFNGKQAPGSYLTALTGDVVASGPGSSAATIQSLAVTNSKIANSTIDLTSKVTGLLPNANVASIPAPEIKYIDFGLGSDVACPASPCGDGSSMRPWHSLNHAYSSVTDESVNKPYTFIISGGNNDPDTTTISAKPNIALFAPYQVQISQPFTIGPDDAPGIGNDVLNFTNITFLFAFNFVKNDASLNTIFAVNTDFNSGPTIKQNGSGWMFFEGFNVTTNNAEFKIGDTGAIFFNPYFNGSTTFDDATSSAYYQFMGGYLGGQLSITGAPFVYSSGMMIDVPFGATWTNVHSANGDPTIQFDSAGLPPSVTGAYNSVFSSFSQYVGYTPSAPTNWSTVPATVKDALNSVRVLSQSVSGSKPVCSSANRGLQWLVQGGAGVADVYQVCQKDAADAYNWTIH